MSANTILNGDSGPSKLNQHPRSDIPPPSAGPNTATSAFFPASKHSIHDAASPAEVRSALAALHARESASTSRLNALLASQPDLSRELGRLDLLRANLGTQVIATRSISNGMLASASETAARLSNRVKELDTEKDRVQQTLHVVEQVAELKACVHGVVGSMGAPQDWEAAAGYIARASKIPEPIIRGAFAASMVPSVEVPDAPWITLENSRESLCGLFTREFEKAASEGDGAKVTRFFKLFPLIGRGHIGLDIYGRYVCQGVAGTARATLRESPGAAGRKDGFFYANALTKLFEHIAQIVEGHGALVERHYGQGKMVKVMERLQAEADVQGGIVLDSWSDERGVDRRLTDVKSYPFSFLVQSFLPPQKSITGTPRVNSPAQGGGTNARNSEDEGVNMKEVDGLLNEISVMLGRWALFSRFIAGKCKDPESPEDALLVLPEVLTKSNLYKKISGKLTDPYNIFSTFFFRRSVEKAFQMDESPSGLSLNLSKPIDGNSPYIISAVDDVMYIVSAVIQRSMSTSQPDVVASVTSTVGRVLGSDFVGMLQRRMRDESKPVPAVRGGLPPEDKIVAFIVLINSLDVSNEYLARVIATRLGTSPEQPNGAAQPDPVASSFPFENDAKSVLASLNKLNASFTAKTSELLYEGLQLLFNNVVKPRIRPILTDTFRDVDYSLTEDELVEIAQQNDEDEEEMLDQAHRRFEQGWDALMKPLGRLMTAKTYNSLMDQTAKNLAYALERRIWNHSGRISGYGGIRMERDFSNIINVVAKGNYGVRELFAKASQILMIANMEEEEWEEIGSEEADEEDFQWVLDEEERRRARNLIRE